MNGPMCCGIPAFKNVISPTLEFYVCKECGKEVLDIPSLEFEGWPTQYHAEWISPDTFGLKED